MTQPHRYGPVLGIAFLILVAVSLWGWYSLQPGDQPPRSAPSVSIRPEVSVVEVVPQSYQAQLKGYGSAQAHYAVTLTAQVSGQVKRLNPAFASGRHVKADTLLAQLEDSRYQAEVASAQQALASARVALLEEQREGAQAEAEWARSGLEGAPESPLVLRQPQLAAAQATLQQAQASLANARHQLKDTRVLAPFDAVVVSRAISPGTQVQSGATLGELVSTDYVEIRVSLPPSDWAQLPGEDQLNAGQWPVTLRDAQTQSQWQGHVIRTEGTLDDTTRQRALILAVDQPFEQTPPLLPGTFVEALIPGRTLNQLWALPATALSQSGKLWYLREDQTLAAFEAQPRFSHHGLIFIEPPEPLAIAPQQVLTQPLHSYTPGMAVTPVLIQPTEKPSQPADRSKLNTEFQEPQA
ncbi:hypothetical protein BFW38_05640 [Terasakiispira papahanaumokuakeensis]|uniref:Multidrug resistance protein MdtA-like barrel-sandwich hybrid domain-containing protein n=1 Tax=Terasakiispira papahanaumokuakeensis TaxID=197479 RepID=A0A1E2V808_9GAMM|nr:efflux RND transporter periplasmic adaptor subunit [Terasakiispira papahanaumokuakeensis]ODC03104.1 hypothetical protein BFW38_05640 [Terasakiispira papahanaumokuakeensis]